MTAAQRGTGWTVLHLVYSSPTARLRLLTDARSGALFGDGRGFFSDVPVTTPAGLL